MSSALDNLTARLARLATHYDITGEWPAASLDHLDKAGAWTWVIPTRYGGHELDPVSQLLAYEAVARGCLSTLLILTQRDGACGIIARGDNEHLAGTMLPQLAENQFLTTVGISQLTTSNQGGKPALLAKPDGDGFRLSGFMPWVTGAAHCRYSVTGAVTPDNMQTLAVVPTDLPGIQIDPPMKLAALTSSWTTEVYCRDAHIDGRLVLRRPCPKALESRAPVKSLVVSAAGIGLAGAMLDVIREKADGAGDELTAMAKELETRFRATRERLFSLAQKLGDPQAEVPKTEMRVAVNDLLMRLAIATLIYCKGSGFIRQREAQRLAREAMFFLVWSAPEDVRVQTLGRFLDATPPPPSSMPRD